MVDVKNIRNFVIIAHIDHGKSTLADRMLEITGTIEKRKMREQVLDEMDLERERGITIKMQPVRMVWSPGRESSTTQMRNDTKSAPRNSAFVPPARASHADGHSSAYVLNLIDTPGHIDFSYEVSRSLKAVEGAVLLVDATQGVEAQTLTTLQMAQELGLVVIPVVSKIDSPLARTEEVKEEVAQLLGCTPDAVYGVSGKTGEGVRELLTAIVHMIPEPSMREKEENMTRALIFDFSYSTHRGIIVYARIFNGMIKKGDTLSLGITKSRFSAQEVGVFTPEQKPTDALGAGEIGYIVSGIKEPGKALVGDTIVLAKNPTAPLSGYRNPQPVVWASVYTESQDDFLKLKNALLELKLSDSSLSFEEEKSLVLGRGYRCGFLGMLHLEIVVERLKREFGLELVLTAPSIVYEIEKKEGGGRQKVYSPAQFPDQGTYNRVFEPMTALSIIMPGEHLGAVFRILHKHEGMVGESESFGEGRVTLEARMPLRELMRGFFDEMKSVSSGFASFSYEIAGEQEARITRLDVLVADEVIPAFSRVVSVDKAYEEAKHLVERLYSLLPRQLFPVKIQGRALGRILSSKTLSALKKDVTGHLYGGDITRKRKLWEKQKKGKKKLGERGKVDIPHEVFLKIVTDHTK